MGRVINITLLATDNLSRGFDRAAKSSKKLAGDLDGLEKAGKGVGLVTLAAGALALTKAMAPAAAAVAALPAALVQAKVATTVFKVGVQNMGNAMKAVGSGDAKKLDEALKKLSPSARAFVKETVKLKKSFDPVQKAVQQRLFLGLDDDIGRLGRNSMPILRTGMVKVAGALNGIAKEAIKTANTPWFRGAVGKIFDSTAKSLTVLKGAVRPLMILIAKLATLGAPLLQRMTGWAVAGLKAAAAFVKSKDGASQLSSVVKQSGDVLAQMGRVVYNLIATIVNLTKASGQFTGQNRNMLDLLEGLTARMAAWSSSAEGQKQITELFQMLGQVFKQMTQILPLMVGPLGLIVKAMNGLPGPAKSVLINLLALTGTVGLVAGRLKLLYAAVGLFKGGKAIVDLGRGFMDVSRGAASGASAAAKFGAILRLNGSAALSYLGSLKGLAAAQLSNARAALASAAAAVRQKIATIASRVAAVAMRAATLAWTGVQWALNAAMSANPIALIVIAIVALIAIFVVAYKKVGWFRDGVNAAFSFIKNAITSWWNNTKPIFMIFVNFIKTVIGTALKWYMAYVKFVFTAVWTVIKVAWNIIRPIFNVIRTWLVSTLKSAFQGFLIVAKAVWNGVKSAISFVWGGIKGIFNALVAAVNAVKRGFQTAVEGIRGAWNKLIDIAKKPANFVIGVYNSGLKPLLENLGKIVGLHPNLPHINKFATGGIMPGYSPGKDSLLAAVSPGESIFRPEFTRAVGSNWVMTANAIAKKSGAPGVRQWLNRGGERLGAEGLNFNRGGTVPGFAGAFAGGGIVGGFLKGLKDFAFGNPEKAFRETIGKLFSGMPGGGGFLHDAIAKIPGWLTGGLVNWFKSKVGSLAAGGPGMHKALGWAKTQAGKPYVWGGVGPGGYDCSGFMSAITNVIHGKSPYSRLFSTQSFGASGGPGGFVRNRSSGFMVGVTNAGVGHMAGTLLKTNVESSGSAGVRVGGGARGFNNAMFPYRYGLKADTGALMLRPGWNPPVLNATGRPELLMTPRPGGGTAYTINVYVAPGADLSEAGRQMVKAIEQYERRNGKGWRTP